MRIKKARRPGRSAPAAAAAALCLCLAACADAVTIEPSGIVASPAAVPHGLEAFYTQSVSWQACEDDDDFQCATVAVPLDYDDPAGATIDLALRKLPASSGEPIGSLLVNPGGPGGSGIAQVSEGAASFSANLRAGFDLIGFDPRGVGASTPLVCLTTQEIAQTAEAAQSPSASDPAEESDDGEVSASALAEEGRQIAADCEHNSEVPGIIDHMDTSSVARDMDVLRALAGDSRLYYLGTSYGTYLGARYAELFPANVGRMVLDSAQDPSLSNEQQTVDQAEARERTLRAYIEQCQQGRDCPLTGGVDQGVRQLHELVERADTAPLPTDYPGVSLDGQTILGIIGDLMYDSSSWPYLTEALTAAIKDDDATELALLGEPGANGLAETTEEAWDYAVSTANAAANYAVDCLDYPVQGDESQWDANAATIEEVAPTLGRGLRYPEAFCNGWGHHGDHEPAEVTAPGVPPILVIGITVDPATPYQWSQALAAQLESGRLLTVEGSGHGAYMHLGGACVDTAVDSYLLRGELPAEGTTCRGDAQ